MLLIMCGCLLVFLDPVCTLWRSQFALWLAMGFATVNDPMTDERLKFVGDFCFTAFAFWGEAFLFDSGFLGNGSNFLRFFFLNTKYTPDCKTPDNRTASSTFAGVSPLVGILKNFRVALHHLEQQTVQVVLELLHLLLLQQHLVLEALCHPYHLLVRFALVLGERLRREGHRGGRLGRRPLSQLGTDRFATDDDALLVPESGAAGLLLRAVQLPLRHDDGRQIFQRVRPRMVMVTVVLDQVLDLLRKALLLRFGHRFPGRH
uniref:Putative secreted protein n=1 Tax=Anopheles marajoara TaxID=58244 RepID=A0A2M4C5S5_9DIPT